MFHIKRGIFHLVKVTETSNKLFRRALGSKKPCKINVPSQTSTITSVRFCSNKPKDAAANETVEIDYATLANGDPEIEHKLKVLALEMEVLGQEGHLVPPLSTMKIPYWQELLKLPSRSGRKRYLEFLFKISKIKENRVAKKEQKRLEWQQTKPEKVVCESIEDFAQTYDLSHNNIFLRFYDSTMNQMYNNRLVQAIQFGQKLVLDCGYDAVMTKRENVNAAKQIMLMFSENRYHDDPFDLHLCNANLDSTLMTVLHKFIPPMYEPSFPMNVHEASYLDLFPKENLVYLTPHCREELLEYDHDAIYIIGGIVDKVNNEPVSLAKAKREGIKMAKFPLDKYLQWGDGSGKSLTLNQVTSILLDVKHTGDWKYAFRHVPRRKLVYNRINSNLDRTIEQRFDRDTRNVPRKWTPKHVNFDKLNYNNNKHREPSTAEELTKERRNRIRSIFDE